MRRSCGTANPSPRWRSRRDACSSRACCTFDGRPCRALDAISLGDRAREAPGSSPLGSIRRAARRPARPRARPIPVVGIGLGCERSRGSEHAGRGGSAAHRVNCSLRLGRSSAEAASVVRGDGETGRDHCWRQDRTRGRREARAARSRSANSMTSFAFDEASRSAPGSRPSRLALSPSPTACADASSWRTSVASECCVGAARDRGVDVRRKVLALLCLLLSKPRFASTREEVARRLWPDQDPGSALNSLNQTVYFLRRVFEPDYRDETSPRYVGQDGETIWLDPDLVDSRSRRCADLIRAMPGDPTPDGALALAQRVPGSIRARLRL